MAKCLVHPPHQLKMNEEKTDAWAIADQKTPIPILRNKQMNTSTVVYEIWARHN